MLSPSKPSSRDMKLRALIDRHVMSSISDLSSQHQAIKDGYKATFWYCRANISLAKSNQ